MNTIQIHTWSDLRQFGINALTGEACAYSMRLLCDVNEDGRDALCDYLGIKPEGFNAPWNSTVHEKLALGSIMLSRETLMPLAQFLLFRAGALACAPYGHCLTGVFDKDRLIAYEDAGFKVQHNPLLHSTAPHVGSRNVHDMTGRAA